jgi:hypothetical protein
LNILPKMLQRQSKSILRKVVLDHSEFHALWLDSQEVRLNCFKLNHQELMPNGKLMLSEEMLQPLENSSRKTGLKV